MLVSINIFQDDADGVMEQVMIMISKEIREY